MKKRKKINLQTEYFLHQFGGNGEGNIGKITSALTGKSGFLKENSGKPALSFQSVLDELGLSEAALGEAEGTQINDLAD